MTFLFIWTTHKKIVKLCYLYNEQFVGVIFNMSIKTSPKMCAKIQTINVYLKVTSATKLFFAIK